MTTIDLEKSMQKISNFEKNYQVLLVKIGNSLETNRTLVGLELEEVAKILDIEESFLKKVEKGKNIDYNLGLLLQLSKLYDMELEELLQ